MKNWMLKLALLGLLLPAAVAYAQTDAPTFRGQSSRTGFTPAPLGTQGLPQLRWWHPLVSTVGISVRVDNAQGAGVYAETGTWTTPGPFEEAGDWFGFGGNPYRYAAVVPTTSTNDPTLGATATATFTIPGLVPGNYYALNVWFPSSGTFSGATLLPNSDFAVYRIEFDDGRVLTDIVPHIGGGNWIRLGRQLTNAERIFRPNSDGTIRVRLYNTVPRDENGNLMGPTANRIVVADAVSAVPSPGSIFASPVVRQIGPGAADVVVFSTRNESRVDPTDPSATLEIELGRVFAINAAGPATSMPRWNWSPNLITSVNHVVDNTNAAQFTADAAWTPSTTSPGFFGTNYMEALVDPVYPGSGVARWTPDLPQDGFYDVYAWFPGDSLGSLKARGARYVINENGTLTELFVDQTAGGNWVRLGNRPFEHDESSGGLRVEVWNHSGFAGDVGRFVTADAVMFVGRYTGAIFSTPTVANVNIRKSSGVVEPTQVVFVAAEDGRIYCLDARGTGTGSTIVYWSYPSIPDPNDPNWVDPNQTIDGPPGNQIPLPGSFGVSSSLVVGNVLYIGAANGRVYAIDVVGRGDYDASIGQPGTAERRWTWPNATYNSATNTLNVAPARPAFVGSVSHDPVSNRIIAPGTEGRVFALDADGNGDKTTDMAWAFPDLASLPIGAVSSTPAVGGGRVIFPSFNGRVYALTATNGIEQWQFPDAGSPALQPFQFTSAAFVPASMFTASPPPTDLVYFVNENGSAYCVQATDGAQVWTAPEVPGGALSSPYFARITPPGRIGTFPIITFGTRDGAFLGLYANPVDTNSIGGRLAWGHQSEGSSVFASPAANWSMFGGFGYMWHAGLDGYLYAFSEGAVISVEPPGFDPPGVIIETPDDPSSGDYANMKLKFIGAGDYAQLRSTPPTGDIDAMVEVTVDVVEWGERLFLVAWDFVLSDPANPPTIRFRVTGPGGLNLQYDRVAQPDPQNPNLGFATIAIPVMGSGPNFLTPGENIQVSIVVIDQGRQIMPPVPPRLITVANPLAVTTDVNYSGTGNAPPGKSIGFSPDPNFSFLGVQENRINGSNDKAIMSSVGQVVHGRSGNTAFFVSDRSRMLELTSQGLTQVRMVRQDGVWQGGPAAVWKPLPYSPAWEELPFSLPNLSRDYPDIDRSGINLIFDPFGNAANPLLSPVRLSPPINFDPNTGSRTLTGVRVGLEVEVPRYQPANLSTFTDTSGEALAGGYRSRAIVYVDSNNNGRPDGIEETLSDLPPGGRREAFRSLNAGGSVPVDERVKVAEQTVDLGALPHSLGYTPGAPWSLNGFVPTLDAANPFRMFFKPFTVHNDGNVNMLDMRVALAIDPQNQPSYPVSFNSAANDPFSWLDGSIHIISNMNPPYSNPPFVPNLNALDASGNQRVTLHKARPGDRAPTQLSVPDRPYGVTPPPNSVPVIGVAVPLGFPVGEYSQLINIVEDSLVADRTLQTTASGQAREPYTDPTMLVKFINRESRLTGGRTTGTATHIDPSLAGPSDFMWTHMQPSAFRDPSGSMHMVWASNRPQAANSPAAAQAQDSWSLFFSAIAGTTPGAVNSPSPLRDLLMWNPAAATRFWLDPTGPLPVDPPNALFAGSPGTVVGVPRYASPSFPVNARTAQPGANPYEYVFWSGRALKDTVGDNLGDRADNRLFYSQYLLSGPQAQPVIHWIARDPDVEKKRLRVLNLPQQDNLAVFWFGEIGGRSRMFQNVRQSVNNNAGDQTANWSENRAIDPGQGFGSTSDPQPILRWDGIDLVFTGSLRDRPQPEIFYARFDANAQGRLGNLRNLPERTRESLAREGGSNTYRARGVNWNTRQAIELYIRRVGQPEARIDITGTRSTDDSTGVISFDSQLGGKIYVDPHVGTVRLASAPGANAEIFLRYTPRVIRVSDLGSVGGHSNASSFLDLRQQSNRTFYFRANGQPIIGTDGPLMTRMWHIYERGATGPGQQKRPYMKTQRLTVQTRFPIAIDSGTGQPLIQSIAGMTGTFYQVDPANNRVYFEEPDEGRVVTISYVYRDAAGNLQRDAVAGPVMWQTEMSERPVPIEQAIDEGTAFAFADPFSSNAAGGYMRPGLVWMFFSSSRAGSRDVYYLTLSPGFGPFVIRN